MPKSVHTINKFKAGIHNEQDARDIPEGAISDGLNVMTDVEGKIRQMGRDIEHPLTAVINQEGFVNTPGYGFFTFGSDQRIKDNINEINDSSSTETSMLVYQTGNTVGIYDIQENNNLLKLGPIENNVKPTFYYSLADGALRVCDANYDNIIIDTDPDTSEQTINFIDSNFLTKYFKFMNKTWFPGTDSSVDHKGWINKDSDGLDSFIYPPTVQSYGTPIVVNATGGEDHTLVYQYETAGYTQGNPNHLDPGCITVNVIDSGASDTSDWLSQTIYKFGVSFNYEGGQESQVTYLTETFGSPMSDDGDYFKLRALVNPGTDHFDPRITGYNVYLTGDDSGLYEDPYFMAEFYWGSSLLDPPRLTTSDGTYTEDFTRNTTSGAMHNTTNISILKTPVITYSMRNGFSTDSDSISINAKTSVIANRRCYAANMRRYAFDIHTIASTDLNDGQNAAWKQPHILPHSTFVDRDNMIVSPVDKYDIFPDGNISYVGSNDGDHIVLLMEYADRIFQFKENKLYIINISEDVEFIESENNYMGISYPYQAMHVEGGIAWINEFGCYYYNGEDTVNLIEGKLGKSGNANVDDLDQAPSWAEYVGKTSMIGYIPKNKQIVVFNSPESLSGNLFIYDMLTESWTRGIDRVLDKLKSNIITTYDNSLLFSSPINTSVQQYNKDVIQNSELSKDESWSISQINTTQITADPQGSQLLIGTTAITDVMNYPDDAPSGQKFSDYVQDQIESYTGTSVFEFTIDDNYFTIIRRGNKIDGTYVGQNLSWSTASSMGAPVNTNSFTISPLISDPTQVFIEYIDGSDFEPPLGVTWLDSGSAAGFMPNSPFYHSMNIGWSSGPRQFMPEILQEIGKYTTSESGTGFDSVNDDEPRIKIDRLDGSNYTWADTSTATQLVVDLYSKHFFDNRGDFIVSGQSNYSPGNIGSNYNFGSNGFGSVVVHLPGLDGEQIQAYSNPLSFNVAYTAAPEEDGSGEDSEDNGSALKQYIDASVGSDYYEALSQITLPSAIFFDFPESTLSSINAKGILIPGSHADKFSAGYYAIGNTGKSSNNATYYFVQAPQILTATNPYDGIIMDSDNDYRTMTLLTYLSGAGNPDFNNIINWTSFNDITITPQTNDMGSISTHTLGSRSKKRERLLTPKRHNDSTASTFSQSIQGQDNRMYSGSLHSMEGSPYSNRAIITFLGWGMQTLFHNRPSTITPWWDLHYRFVIPKVSRLFCANGVGITTTGDLTNSDTTPFDITLGAGSTVEQIVEAIKPLDILMARNGSTYEVMSVASVSGSTITVIRNYLNQSSTGSAINFGTADVDWYRVTSLKQTGSTTFEISGDYSNLIQNDTELWIQLRAQNDTGGGNTWADVTATKSNALSSSYSAATNRTTVTIHSDYGPNTSLGGTDASTYIALPYIFGDNMAGDQPGNETISIATSDYIPAAGSGTTGNNGVGIHDENILCKIWGIHVIYNDPDFFPDASEQSNVYTGVTIRQFNNNVSDTGSDNSSGNISPSITTNDVILDEDPSTKKVLYDISVTYKSSNYIEVDAIINGRDKYELVEDPNSRDRSGRTGGGRGNLGGQNDSLPWITQRFYIPNNAKIKNMKTIKIKVTGGSYCSGFEVNDISINYRTLDTGR